MKHKNLILLFILIIVWSLFFAIYKYFMWWIFKTEDITLQYISGYLSIGTIWAFIVGWLLYELLREKKYHFVTILFTLISIISIYFLSSADIVSNYSLVWWITLIVWFFYWLWWVLRNILISTQIHESNLWDTKINGLANIFFITSIIIWSIVWWMIAEKVSINGIFIICAILFIWLISGGFLWYKNLEKTKSVKEKALEYKKSYIADFLFIIRKYFIIMTYIALIITIATILSQKAIEYNVDILKKLPSDATFILLYSAVWSILWNIISMKIHTHRWHYFLWFSIFFALSTFLFPIFISNFDQTKILAFIAWLFFWITYNLLESYFFRKIAEDNKKSFGSATLWIVTSSVIALLMFLVDFIQKMAWFNGVYYFMWSIILVIWVSIFSMKNRLD